MNSDVVIVVLGLIALESWLIRGNVKELIQVQTKILKILENSQSSLSSIESDIGSELSRTSRIREIGYDPFQKISKARESNP